MLHHQWFAAFIHAFTVMSLVFIFSGCAKQQTRTADVGSAPESKQEVVEEKKAVPETQRQAEIKQELQPSVVEKEAFAEKKEEATVREPLEKKVTLKTHYIVKKGDCLWWIAKYKDVYNDSFLWSIIYEANRDKVKDPNLIYPGEKIDIPRKGHTMEKIKNLRKKAGAAKPYLPPKHANLPVD